MDVKELKELIKLYEGIKETGLSVQEFLHYIKHLEK